MTTTAPISLPSLNDMVFEGRNKAYGAYALRRLYGRHVLKALGLAGILLLLLVAVPIIIQTWWPSVEVVAPIIPEGPTIDIMPPPNFVQPPVTPPPATQATISLRTNLDEVPTKVVKDELVTKPDQPAVAPPAIDGPVARGDVNLDGTGGLSTKPGAAKGGNDTVAGPAALPVSKPFDYVEVMPEFVGGNAAMMQYLQRHLRYPMQALKAGVEGRVFIAFTVNPDGTISDVDVLKGLGYGTDEEASRVISQMPTWKPGYQNHRAVPVRYNLPITFHYQ